MAVKQFAVGFSKFIIGVVLALAVIGLAGVATAKYFLTRLSHLPERPVYNNDSPQPEPAANSDAFTAPADADPSAAETTEQNTAQTEAEPEEEPTEKGLYDVTVVQAIGLLVRSGPGPEHGQLGGVDYEARLTVLEESNGWLRIRSADGFEGWVKGGRNVQRSN